MLVLFPLAVAMVVVFAGVIFVGGVALAEPRFVIPKTEDTREIVMRGGVFGPVVAIVHVGESVTWTNLDDTAHSAVAFPADAPQFQVAVAPGKSGSMTFTQPGVYRYYSREDACYNPQLNSVEANAASPAFPAPMRGAIVVLGKGDTVPLSASTTVNISDGSRLFEPWAVTVRTGSTVTWINHDCGMHVVATVPQLAATVMPTLSLPGDGGTASHTFRQPGVYYYDCSGYAEWDASRGTVVPLKSHGSFPHVMDGLVIVTP
jgi:plastocyanin